jgi:hypothetical protein
MASGAQILFNALNYQKSEDDDNNNGGGDGKTIWGASGNIDSNNMNQLGMKLTRVQCILNQFTKKGVPKLDAWLDQGVTVDLNCNVSLIKMVDGKKVPNPFLTDLVMYDQMLRDVVKMYQGKVIFTIENEPTNNHMHSGPMTDYLKLLKVAIDIVHEYDSVISDGCVHVELVNSNKVTEEGGSGDVNTLIYGNGTVPGFKDLDLDFQNLHTHGEGNSFGAGQIKKAADKLRTITGHQHIISNEWHVQNGTNALITDMVNQWADAGVVYSIYISGSSDTDDSIVSGGTLNSLGLAYKAATEAASKAQSKTKSK